MKEILSMAIGIPAGCYLTDQIGFGSAVAIVALICSAGIWTAK